METAPKNQKWLLVILALILAGAIGYGIYSATKAPSRKSNPVPTENPQSPDKPFTTIKPH